MRSGAWSWAVVALLGSGGCSGGYPLPPTRCDDWCDATKGLQCEYYSPASCVSECESTHFDDPSCSAAMDAVLTCFNHTPGAAEEQCTYELDQTTGTYERRPCQSESEALGTCAAVTFQGSYGFPGAPSQGPEPSAPSGDPTP
jgi:hypothetical protein